MTQQLASAMTEFTIRPVALQLVDGNYLVSANHALGLWDQVTVIPCDTVNDPHFAAWALFQVAANGTLDKFKLVCDDLTVVEAALDSLQSV